MTIKQLLHALVDQLPDFNDAQLHTHSMRLERDAAYLAYVRGSMTNGWFAPSDPNDERALLHDYVELLQPADLTEVTDRILDVCDRRFGDRADVEEGRGEVELLKQFGRRRIAEA